MKLPEYIRDAVDRLEQAGFATYAVGGCVRDSVLGLMPQDYDLCTAALPEQIRQVFAHRQLVLAGEKHGTVSVVTDRGLIEITTFRTEGGYDDSRHPDWVRFVPAVEEDLSRRDFTVNAMAWSPDRGFADPFGGQEDLQAGILRCVGDPRARFAEDALRILRGVRFSVRYGLKVEPATKEAMFDLAPLLDKLARERVFDELCKLLPHIHAAQLLEFAPILVRILPELAPCLGFDQKNHHHACDVFTHTARVVEAMPPDPVLRLAALLHDVGKPVSFYMDERGVGHFPDHAKLGAELADAALRRLRASNELRSRVVSLIERHMTPLEPDPKLLRRRLSRYSVEGTYDLLALQRADFGGKGTGEETDHFDRVEAMLAQIISQDACLSLRDLAINGKDLLALGFAPGKTVGRCLEMLLEQVLAETIPNEKAALQEAALRFLHTDK